jgi:hypothetical protein
MRLTQTLMTNTPAVNTDTKVIDDNMNTDNAATPEIEEEDCLEDEGRSSEMQAIIDAIAAFRQKHGDDYAIVASIMSFYKGTWDERERQDFVVGDQSNVKVLARELVYMVKEGWRRE